METARVAALRGHDVTLFEKSSRLGGKLPLAAMIKGVEVEDVRPVISYLTTQVGKLNIKVRLGEEATVSKILPKVDAVVIATGACTDCPRSRASKTAMSRASTACRNRSSCRCCFPGPAFDKLTVPAIGKRIGDHRREIEGL
ncbi:MAG: hypothetical protein ACLSHC_05340 [Bilophila wadsworthia]